MKWILIINILHPEMGLLGSTGTGPYPNKATCENIGIMTISSAHIPDPDVVIRYTCFNLGRKA